MDGQIKVRVTDEKLAFEKACNFCAYQERSQQEARDKLYEIGLYPDAVERVISELIQGGFINEDRFAKAYAKGKFSQKAWGRIKIKQGLKLKRVPDGLIKKALLIIDADDYTIALKRVLEKKAATLPEKNALKRRYKLQQYAMGRGYEADIIADVLKNSDL